MMYNTMMDLFIHDDILTVLNDIWFVLTICPSAENTRHIMEPQVQFRDPTTNVCTKIRRLDSFPYRYILFRRRQNCFIVYALLKMHRSLSSHLCFWRAVTLHLLTLVLTLMSIRWSRCVRLTGWENVKPVEEDIHNRTSIQLVCSTSGPIWELKYSGWCSKYSLLQTRWLCSAAWC